MSSIRNLFTSNNPGPMQDYKYDLSSYEESLAISRSVFKVIGIRLTIKESKFRRICWDVFYWFEFINIFVACCLETVNMVQTTREGSVMDMFKTLPCSGYVIISLAKSYKIVHCRPVFENLVNELRGMWPQRKVTKEEHLILSKALKQLRYISSGYYWCNVTLNTIFVSLPYVAIVKRLIGKDVPLILTFGYWLPFDPFQSGYYAPILLLQTWHCITSVWFMLAGDLLFYVFMSHITTQFDLLATKVARFSRVPVDEQLADSNPLAECTENVSEQVENVPRDDERESTQYREMVTLITRHQALIRLSGDVEDMFSFSLLLNFLNSSIIICFCGFCSVFAEKWNVMVYKTFLLTATVQIWLLCWYGQKLLDSSKGISEALYNSGWYTTSKRMQKFISIMMHRSQRQVNVTTFGFSIVSLASYATIIKTSWSYFTLLVNMYQ